MTDAVKRSRKWWWIPGVLAIIMVLLVLPSFFVPAYDGVVSAHFDGRQFSNIPENRKVEKSVLDIVRWRATRDPGPWTERRDNLLYTPPERVAESLRVTFVNHATVLIQTDGLNILSDPVWSERVSPFALFGPKRFLQPGIHFEDLPPIDVVLISHNHYDHLDAATLRLLTEWHDPLFIAPLGNTRYLRKYGVERITELDWWQSTVVDGLKIHAVPAQHWSRRNLYDTNLALWCGYVIDSSTGPVYFAGDTGMGPHFESIRARLGPPRLAMLPIGAYLPRWFMGPQHIDPNEAVSAHVLLGAEQSMAIHFGTFKLGDDGQDEPIDDLRNALRNADIASEQFWIPNNGESRQFEITDERLARIVAR